MNHTIVLCYHAVSERWPAALSVTPERFEDQLRLLRDRGYRGTTFTEAATGARRGRRVAITFDDGYLSVLELAKPLLDEYGFTATLYVPTDYIGLDGPMVWPGIDPWLGTEHEHELRPLTWDQVGELRDAGWEIGGHTCSHPHLTELDDDRLRAELTDSKAIVEQRLGQPCTSIAYPYGDMDDRVVAAAERAGYTAAASLPDRPYAPRALDWPRIGVYHNDQPARYRRKVSRAVRAVQRSPAWPAAAWVVRKRAALRG